MSGPASAVPNADFLDAVTMLEDREFSRGLASGETEGNAAGYEEGRSLGEERGFAVGQELGFVLGAVRALRALLDSDEHRGALGKARGSEPSARLRPALDKLEAMIAAYPRGNEETFDTVVELQKIRAKFLVVKALAGLTTKASLSRGAPPTTAFGF